MVKAFHHLQKWIQDGNRIALTGILSLWGLLLLGGFQILLVYDFTPGTTDSAPVFWPQETGLSRKQGQSTLLMFVHPQCACSRASIESLSAFRAKIKEPLAIQVLFILPKQASEQWVHSDNWHQATAIPGVQVLVDSEGLESKRFHATISGQTLLYDKMGQLRFNGGITDSRGHIGEGIGQQHILALLNSAAPEVDPVLPTFGCELFGKPKPSESKRLSQ